MSCTFDIVRDAYILLLIYRLSMNAIPNASAGKRCSHRQKVLSDLRLQTRIILELQAAQR